jgi:hypothetical protein
VERTALFGRWTLKNLEEGVLENIQNLGIILH